MRLTRRNLILLAIVAIAAYLAWSWYKARKAAGQVISLPTGTGAGSTNAGDIGSTWYGGLVGDITGIPLAGGLTS